MSHHRIMRRATRFQTMAAILTVGCGSSMAEDTEMMYRVARTGPAPSVNLDWDGAMWGQVQSLELDNFMGEKPSHFPPVRAKLLYDDEAIYVIFRVQDQYVRAVAEEHQGAVYRDSCVEFFFTPHEDVEHGYFNLEMNCGGTMLLHYQLRPRRNSVPFKPEHVRQIEVAHSLPRIVEPEIATPQEWIVAYRLPIDLLQEYFPQKASRPAAGVKWRANFYKCADGTSHPHWLTWAPVKFRRPDFHRPADFATLQFD